MEIYKKQITYRKWLAYQAVFLATLAPYYLYLFYSHSFSNYIIFNWIVNIKSVCKFSPLGILWGSFQENIMLWIFCTWSLFLLEKPGQKKIAIIALGLLISAFFLRATYKQYFIMSAPLIAILSAHAINSIFKKNSYMLTIVLILSIIYPTYCLLSLARKNSNHEQLEKIAYVLSATEAKDFVYDGDILFNVFRKDLDFFWFQVSPKDGLLATYRGIKKYDYDIYALINKYRPKIISDYYIENMQDERIRNYYVQSDKYKDLFLRIDSP